MSHQHLRAAEQTRNRREALEGAIAGILVDSGAHNERSWRAEKQSVAVWLCKGGGSGANRATGSRSVFDDDWLPETRRQPVGQETHDDFSIRARRKGNNDCNRSRWIGLRW